MRVRTFMDEEVRPTEEKLRQNEADRNGHIAAIGALGYSTDTPLARMMRSARSTRLVDGADEAHQQAIARNVSAAYQRTRSTKRPAE